MNTLILGKGYCGLFLLKAFPGSKATQLPDLCRNNDIPFDFEDISTWTNLPDFDQAVITFKMVNEQLAKKFREEILQNKRTVILSSARCFQNTVPDETISESTSLSDNKRNAAESLFINTAALLHLGLIIGPGREPLKWLEEGRIKSGRKFVNVINVKDLVDIVQFFLNNELNGRFLVSDGIAKRWQNIADLYNLQLPSQQCTLTSKCFNTAKLNSVLPNNFNFRQLDKQA